MSGFLNNSVRVYPTKLKIGMLDHMNNTFRNTVFQISVDVSLIWKNSAIHMSGLVVYVKEGVPFAQDLSLEKSGDSYLCFGLVLLYSVTYFFFLYQYPSSSWCMVFDSILSNLMRLSQSTHLRICLSLKTLTSIIRTC